MEQISPGDCPFLREGEEELLFDRKKRFLRHCLECPRFLEDLRDMNTVEEPLPVLLTYAVEDLLSLRAQVQTLALQAEGRNREIKFLHEVSVVLQTSVDVEEVIAMTLTAVTAGQGFGLNRAILLLVDKDRQFLKGHFAVGPRSREDAGRIWREVAARNFTLREMARVFFEQKMAAEKEKFRDLLERLTVPLSNADHLFVQVLNQQMSRHITDLSREPDIDPDQVAALGVGEMVLVPLVSKSRRIGLLLADNLINGQPISTEDLHSLETFALPVSLAIERAALYQRLREELVKLTEANRRIQEQQEQILRMEKMALVGKITANIAHSIRNPLTIIGGFARTLSKSTPQDDPKRQYIESIVREARRLEEVLEEVLNYSETLHPTFDLWDVNQMVAGVYASLQEDLEMSGVDFNLEFSSDLPLVRVDYKKMTYCLRTIINNALEATPRGGRMEMRTYREGEEVHILLSDTGQGMSPEVLQAAGKLFFSTKETGSGLGLPLCTRILQEHGARMEIHSGEGAETRILIHLPIPPQEGSG